MNFFLERKEYTPPVSLQRYQFLEEVRLHFLIPNAPYLGYPSLLCGPLNNHHSSHWSLDQLQSHLFFYQISPDNGRSSFPYRFKVSFGFEYSISFSFTINFSGFLPQSLNLCSFGPKHNILLTLLLSFFLAPQS